MGEWKVVPNEGVTGTGPKFKFPENKTAEPIEYTISYTGEECPAGTEYKYTIKGTTTENISPSINISENSDCELCGSNYYPTKFTITLDKPITGDLSLEATGGCGSALDGEEAIGSVNLNNSKTVEISTSNFNFSSANKGIRKLIIKNADVKSNCTLYKVEEKSWEGKCDKEVCSLYSPIPESGINIKEAKEYSFAIFSYTGTTLNVEGAQRVPTVNLQNGLREDEYIKINRIEEASTPIGMYYIFYTIKKIPTYEYITLFIATNECHEEKVGVKITIKPSEKLKEIKNDNECDTQWSFSSTNGDTLSNAEIKDASNDPTGGDGEIIISQIQERNIEARCRYFYKVDNSNPDIMTGTVKTTASNGKIYENKITATSKWAFNSAANAVFTNAPNMPPSPNNPTTVYVYLKFCGMKTYGDLWNRMLQELANKVTSNLPIIWNYTYWTSETTTAQTSYTSYVSAQDIKNSLVNFTTTNIAYITAKTPSNHNLPGAYWGSNHNKTYCLDLKIILAALPKSLYRGSDWERNFGAGSDQQSACKT